MNTNLVPSQNNMPYNQMPNQAIQQTGLKNDFVYPYCYPPYVKPSDNTALQQNNQNFFNMSNGAMQTMMLNDTKMKEQQN